MPSHSTNTCAGTCCNASHVPPRNPCFLLVLLQQCNVQIHRNDDQSWIPRHVHCALIPCRIACILGHQRSADRRNSGESCTLSLGWLTACWDSVENMIISMELEIGLGCTPVSQRKTRLQELVGLPDACSGTPQRLTSKAFVRPTLSFAATRSTSRSSCCLLQ